MDIIHGKFVSYFVTRPASQEWILAAALHQSCDGNALFRFWKERLV